MAHNTKPPQDNPNASQWALMRAYCVKIGMSQSDINAMIGLTPSGRNNGEIAEQARDWAGNR